MAGDGPGKGEPTGIVVLPCSGLDKEAGSASREISLLLSERGVPVVCPVLYQRSPRKYHKELSAGRLVVIDGCRTGCASKLAADRGLKIARKLNVTEAAGALGVKAGKDPHLGDALRELLPALAEGLLAERPEAPEPRGAGGAFSGSVSYREFSVDKFVFRVPSSGYFFNENDCWARVEGNRARVGVSDYVQQSASDVIFFEPPQIGAEVDIFGEVGSLETTKTALDIISPVSGKVVAVNQELVEAPELINQDPYERGWAVEIELADFDSDRELLMDSPAYFDYLRKKRRGSMRNSTAVDTEGQMEGKKIYVIPCSGIGKATASVGRGAAYRVVEDERPECSETMCLALLTLGDEEALREVRGADVITIDGCAKDCARKNVEASGRPPTISHRVHDYLKEHRELKPETVLDIGEGGRKLVDVIAEDIADEIDELMNGCGVGEAKQ